MRPDKPESREHEVVRCDGSKVTWREEWVWRFDECEECGRPYEDGEWIQRAAQPSFHVGEFEPDEKWLGPRSAAIRAAMLSVLPPKPGVWKCCDERFEGGDPRVHAVIRDIQDPAGLA